MTRPPNPIAQGFRATSRNLAIVFLEIIWRWSFTAIAALLVFQIGRIIVTQLQINDVVALAWRTQNYRLLGMAGISILLKPLPLLWTVALELVALAFVLGFFWCLLATIARRITVRRFEPTRSPLGFGGMLTVQWLRAMTTVFGGLLLAGAFLGAIYFATKGSKTDPFRFYVIVAPSIVVIVIAWLIFNWYFSQAAIFGRAGQGFRSALREARRNIRRHPSDFAGIAFIFLLLRLVLVMIAVAIIGLTSSMMASAPQPYFTLLVIVVLAFCVFADFLYIARTGAYLALAAVPDPIAAEMGIVDPELPVENSSPR
jgi:hypothetical protein